MEIRAFRGWRYCPKDGDVSKLIAPPYDVLSAGDKQALLGGSAQNIVAVDMPHVPPKEAGPDEVYASAAARLAQWQAGGIIKQDSTPSLYVYEQTFQWAGRSYTRRALLCGVRATEFGKDVIPHEHTFAGPKADRLKLMQQTRTQLSPIFGFYDDPAGAVVKTLFTGLCCPTIFGRLGGVEEKLWVVSDAAVVQSVAAALKSVPVFIADGHHRYTTAMIYRDSLGQLPPDHEANFVMFALVARNDPGMKILPTHRVIRGLKPGFDLAQLRQVAPEFDWAEHEGPIDLSDADAALGKFGPGAMAFIDRGAKEVWIARLRNSDAMAQAAPEEGDAWRSLDVSILHKLILDKALAPWKTDAFAVEYTPHGQAVMETMRSGGADLGACIQSTPLETVETIARAGAFMPHKSTYFYPKLATGMVLKPLE